MERDKLFPKTSRLHFIIISFLMLFVLFTVEKEKSFLSRKTLAFDHVTFSLGRKREKWIKWMQQFYSSNLREIFTLHISAPTKKIIHDWCPDLDLSKQTRFYELYAYICRRLRVRLSRNLRLCIANLCLYYYICSSAVLHGTWFLLNRSESSQLV